MGSVLGHILFSRDSWRVVLCAGLRSVITPPFGMLVWLQVIYRRLHHQSSYRLTDLTLKTVSLLAVNSSAGLESRVRNR